MNTIAFKALIKVSIQKQIDFNNKATPGWIDNPPDYQLAAIQEASELINHYPWKWWAKTEPTSEFQKKLEIADIFCFELSNAISQAHINNVVKSKGDLECFVIDKLLFQTGKRPLNIISEILAYINYAIARNPLVYSKSQFAYLASGFVTSNEELLLIHQAKMVLNNFRRENGYKEGKYNKIWFGEEDNCYLENIVEKFSKYTSMDVEEIGMSPLNFDHFCHKELYEAYQAVQYEANKT